MKYIDFYVERTLFDSPNINRLIDFYMDNKQGNGIGKSLLQSRYSSIIRDFQFNKVNDDDFIDSLHPKAPNLNTFKMANIYDSTKTATKQWKSQRKEKILVKINFNKEDQFYNHSEFMFKKNKKHNE